MYFASALPKHHCLTLPALPPQLTHNGLDLLVRQTMKVLSNVATTNESIPVTSAGPDFHFYYTTRNVTIGGFTTLNRAYRGQGGEAGTHAEAGVTT